MFHKLEEINWLKGSIFVGCVIVFWSAIEGVVPEPYHDKVLTVLAAVSAALGFWLKGSKEA